VFISIQFAFYSKGINHEDSLDGRMNMCETIDPVDFSDHYLHYESFVNNCTEDRDLRRE